MTAATYLTTPVVLPAPVQGEFPAGVEQASVAPLMIYGTGAPTGTVSAPPGSLYTNTSDGSVYSKSSTGTSGWAAAGGGGGGIPTLAKGGLVTHSTVDAALTVGTNGYVLTADSAQALGIKWAALPATPLAPATKGDLTTFGSAAALLSLSGAPNGSLLMASSGETTGLIWDNSTYASKSFVNTFFQQILIPVVRSSTLNSGDTYSAGTGHYINGVIVDSDSVANLTVHLTNDGDGSICRITFGGAVTGALTWADSAAGSIMGTPPTTAVAGDSFAFTYELATTTWWPIS